MLSVCSFFDFCFANPYHAVSRSFLTVAILNKCGSIYQTSGIADRRSTFLYIDPTDTAPAINPQTFSFSSSATMTVEPLHRAIDLYNVARNGSGSVDKNPVVIDAACKRATDLKCIDVAFVMIIIDLPR